MISSLQSVRLRAFIAIINTYVYLQMVSSTTVYYKNEGPLFWHSYSDTQQHNKTFSSELYCSFHSCLIHFHCFSVTTCARDVTVTSTRKRSILQDTGPSGPKLPIPALHDLSVLSQKIINKYARKGGTEVIKKSKGCTVNENCVSGSVNNGDFRTVTSIKCCNTDLCNSKDAPVPSNSPNGKQCYYCDAQGCFNKLNCLGDEDYCFNLTETGESVTVKGCGSKSFCDAAQEKNHKNFSCCQGNLCNGAKSVTQNLLFLLWPLFFFIVMH
ncbi:uncharacterized protein [Paramisgurnus dabryanus]|uniref:uncharacterized protein isoform X1 n=1 Tax=Paramisgurnus dabryanus TaxID=90735 RepID=UPI0031F42012